MTPTTSLNDLILAIYRAAEDPREWAAALDAIRLTAGASGVAIVHQEFPITGRNVNAYSGFSDEAIRSYEAYYYQLDPWGGSLKPADWEPGRVIDGREVVPAAVVGRSEWLADFGHRHGCAKAVFGILEPFGARVAALTLNRWASQPDFDNAERRLLQVLTPHLRQAFRVHRRITDAEGGRAHFLGGLGPVASGRRSSKFRGASALLERRGRAYGATP